MASSSEFYAVTAKLKEIVREAEANGLKGIKFQVFIKDETDKYNNNVAVKVSPTKEEKEDGIKTPYLGNGRTYWTDGKATAFEYKGRDEQQQQAPARPQTNIEKWHSSKGVEEVETPINDDDLPF